MEQEGNKKRRKGMDLLVRWLHEGSLEEAARQA